MRCYNGCPDDEFQAVIDARTSALKEARERGVNITYFPVEEKWAACTSLESNLPYRELSGFHDHPRQALEEAIRRL